LLERFSHSARPLDMYVGIAKSHGRFADADRVVATRTALLERGGAEETPVLCGLYVLRADLQREFGDARRSDSLAHVAVSRCPYQRDIWQSAGWDMLAAGDLAGARRAAERYGGFSDAPSRWLTG